MKARLMAVAASAAMFAGALRAEYQIEKVDGYTWTYQIVGGTAVIGYYTGGSYQTAVWPKPGGAVAIPAKLGGKAVTTLDNSALRDCSSITSVEIPATVTHIGNYAFYGCNSLRSVKIPDATTSVNVSSFGNCESLQCVTVGKKVNYIGSKAFGNSAQLRSLVFAGNAPGTVLEDAFDGVDAGCTAYAAKSAKGWPDYEPGSPAKWRGLWFSRGSCTVPVNVRVQDGMQGLGSVSDTLFYDVGKKATLKATPAKNCVFAGWYDAETGMFLGYAQPFSYVVTGADTDFRATFATVTQDENLGVYPESKYTADADGLVFIDFKMRVSSWSEPKLVFKGLPPGVKYDAKKMAIVGKATKPGRYKVTVSATNKTVKKATEAPTAGFTLVVPNWQDGAIQLADVYGPFIPGVEVDPFQIAGAYGCKASGLPPGMKWAEKESAAAPAGSYYGTPTKPGDYTVTFTKTTSDKVKHTATATFTVDSFIPLSPYVIGNGNVSGFGEYPANAKARLKATPASGWVFSGWYYTSSATLEGIDDGNLSLISHSSSYEFKTGIWPTLVVAKFVKADVDANPANVSLELYGFPPLKQDETASLGTIRCGVYVMWPVLADALSATTVKVSGLPAGLKYTAKDIRDSNNYPVVPANSIYGVPTKAGPYTAKITVTTAGKNSFSYGIEGDVEKLDGWAVGQFEGFGGPTVFPGPVSLSVAENGKISGKFLSADGSVCALSAPYFDDYDEKDCRYRASVTCKDGKNDWDEGELTVSDKPMGEPAATMTGGIGDMTLYKTFWKSEGWKDVGKEIDKAVFEYDEGDSAGNIGSLALTFKADGSVKTKGVFKNKAGDSYTANGSSTLVLLELPDGNGSFRAFVNVYFPPKKNFVRYFETMYLRWDGKEKKFFALDM